MQPHLVRAFVEMRADASFTPPADTTIKPRVIGANTPTRWYHVANVGETRNGFALEREYLEAYVADFYARPEPGPVYRGHVDVEGTPNGEEPAAAAWVLALHLGEDGKLWALYELTERLHREIAEGGYKFNSIVGGVVLDEDGEEVGASFISIAVTNRPAVPDLTPMAASTKRTPHGLRALGAKNMKSDFEYLKEAMKELGDKATLETVMKWVQAKKQLDGIKDGGGEGETKEPAAASDKSKTPAVKATEPAKDAPKTEPAPEVKLEEPPAAGAGDAEAAAKEELYAIVSAAASAAGMDVATVLGALRDRAEEFVAWVGSQPGSGTPAEATALTRKLAAKEEAIVALSSRAVTAETELARLKKAADDAKTVADKAKAEADVDELVKCGRALPTQRDTLVKMAINDRPNFDEFVKTAPQVVPVGRVAAKDGPKGGDADVDMTPQNDAEKKFLLTYKGPDAIKRSTLKRMRDAAAVAAKN